MNRNLRLALIFFALAAALLLVSVTLAEAGTAQPPTAITDYGTAGPVQCDGLRCCTTLTARRGAYTYRRRDYCRIWPARLSEGAKYRAYMWRVVER